MDQEPAALIAQRIKRCFREIELENMAGIPILNTALSVETVGLQAFADEWLCILITPWFMNVMLLPATQSAAEATSALPGTKQTVSFPAGQFEMICGFDARIGHYRMCSLFSPVLEFADQESAVAAAQAALAEVLTENAQTDQQDDIDMIMIWDGERPQQNGNKHDSVQQEKPPHKIETEPQHTIAARPPAPLNRRGLLFGSKQQEKAR